MEPRTIAIDLDDTAWRFQAEFIAWYNREYGTAWTIDDMRSYRLWETLGGTEEEMTEILHRFYDSREFSELPPMPGSVEAIRELREHHNVVFVTARSTDLLPVTRMLIDRYFGELPIEFANHHAKNTLPSRSKSEICTTIGACLHFEDGGAFATEVADAGIPVILFDHPWNRDTAHENVIRVRDWSEAITHARRLLDQNS